MIKPYQCHESLLEREERIRKISKDNLTDKQVEALRNIVEDLEIKYGRENIDISAIENNRMTLVIKNIEGDDSRRRF